MSRDMIQPQASSEDWEPTTALIERLLAARNRAGLSQAEVARRMNSHPPTVCRLETGHHLPTFALLARYAEATGCELRVDLIPRD